MKIGTPSKFQTDKGILVSCLATYPSQRMPDGVLTLIRSCKQFGIQLTLFGIDTPWQNLYETKIVYHRQCLEECHSQYHYFLHIDASDCVIIRDLETIFEIGTSVNNILFAAEKNLCPDTSAVYPPCQTSYRYLNGGGFFGSIELALEGLRDPCPDRFNNDQGSWTTAYLSGRHPITIDSHCRLFQTLFMTKLEDFEFQGKYLVNKETGTAPCIIHGNGCSWQHGVGRLYWNCGKQDYWH